MRKWKEGTIMKKMLIRADDLGYSEGVNYGIEKSVKEGIIKNVGFMVNMPATEHGWNLLKGTTVCLGQHTNICVGSPLTDPSLIPSITTKTGEFKSSKEYRAAEKDFVVLEEVILEIEAQYKRFVELVGEQPHYFEGHAVSSPHFFEGLEIVAKKYGLKYSGMPEGELPMKVGNTLLYVSMDSMKPTYDPFESIQKMIEKEQEDGCGMIVFHPGYLDDFILKHSSLTIPRTLEVETACNPKTRELLEKAGVTLLTYDDL